LCFPFLFFLLHGFSSVVPGEDSVSCFLFPFFVSRVSAPSHGRFFRLCLCYCVLWVFGGLCVGSPAILTRWR
jgi:hypothetical protein